MAGNLNSLEHAVVVIAFDRRQATNHIGVAGAERRRQPAMLYLCHRRKLDADIHRAFGRQETGRLIAIESHIGISKVADDHKAITLG